ncbi:MAG: hypothetical protein M1831_006290 [Alyxoria varia]|nr:MAG: hypothetical protein M1831_006290 [Alyxoria varia]
MPQPTVSDNVFLAAVLKHLNLTPDDVDWHAIARSTGYMNVTSARARFTRVKTKFVNQHRAQFRGIAFDSRALAAKRKAEAMEDADEEALDVRRRGGAGTEKVPIEVDSDGDGDDDEKYGNSEDSKGREKTEEESEDEATPPAKKRRTQPPKRAKREAPAKANFGLVDLTADAEPAYSQNDDPAPKREVADERRNETRCGKDEDTSRKLDSPNEQNRTGHAKRYDIIMEQGTSHGQKDETDDPGIDLKPSAPAKEDSTGPSMKEKSTEREGSLESWEEFA